MKEILVSHMSQLSLHYNCGFASVDTFGVMFGYVLLCIMCVLFRENM